MFFRSGTRGHWVRPTPALERATRGLLWTDHVILNHDQVTRTTPELAPPLLTTTPHQREDVSALDRFKHLPNDGRHNTKAEDPLGGGDHKFPTGISASVAVARYEYLMGGSSTEDRTVAFFKK
ncbi:hypothetical protein TNCV_3654231 [Trichonephila clavipes]|nr:hypothetical protein TNCV_3654231 [Trichonephila clavipes]